MESPLDVGIWFVSIMALERRTDSENTALWICRGVYTELNVSDYDRIKYIF